MPNGVHTFFIKLLLPEIEGNDSLVMPYPCAVELFVFTFHSC